MAVETDLFPPRFRSPKLIGHGGMGDIYLATDETLGRAVAIKILAVRYADDEAVRGRFTREALAAARLSSDPNTVTIFDVGEWRERPFLVMEYMGGGSLEQRLREGGEHSPEEALEWLEQAARALDTAHAQGVVHRDVKPGNLLLDGEDNVHVADFGIATAAGLDSLTQTGTILGTAGYLSPEQAQGERATGASDVYALGVVAFELLTGERPFQSESTTAEASAHVHAPIPSISERNPALPGGLDRVFERVLAKDPADRFQTGGAFVDALGRALAQRREGRTFAAAPNAAATVPMLREREAMVPGRPPRRPLPLLPILVALLLLLGATGAVLAAVLADDGGDARVTTFVTTVREQGTAQRETVTTTTEAPPPPPAQTPPPAPPPAASGASGEQLNNEGFAKMQAGDYEGALPLLEEAVSKLAGSGSTTEAYALYNLAFTRFALGNCDGVLEMLDGSESIQGPRKEIDKLRKSAQKRCG
jgi:eukaryotic-like serine/threonine-protein kinase